jgi:hypothetical protein
MKNKNEFKVKIHNYSATLSMDSCIAVDNSETATQ